MLIDHDGEPDALSMLVHRARAEMRGRGKVDIPQEAFIAALKMDAD